MSDIKVSVRSNLDALSESVLHDAFKSLVRDSVREMRDFARGISPKRSEALSEHIKDEDVIAVAEMIEGRVGVKAVEEADARHSHGRYRRSQYPLFVAGGTHSPIFAARPDGLLWNPSEGIFGRKSVSGQKAQPFMAETFAQAHAFLDADPSVRIALDAMAARAAAEMAAIEATD